MLIHRRHNQPRTSCRIPQRCGRRGHRSRLITNHPRTRAPLISHHATSTSGLPRIGIQPRHPRPRPLIRPTSASHTTTQATTTGRQLRHPTSTPTTSSEHPTTTAPTGREQPMRTSQQPIHPSHKLANTHPPKLTRANPLRRNHAAPIRGAASGGTSPRRSTASCQDAVASGRFRESQNSIQEGIASLDFPTDLSAYRAVIRALSRCSVRRHEHKGRRAQYLCTSQ